MYLDYITHTYDFYMCLVDVLHPLPHSEKVYGFVLRIRVSFIVHVTWITQREKREIRTFHI